MDVALITSLTSVLVAAGGGVGFFIKRADTRRQANEEHLIRHLTAELAKKEAEIAKLNLRVSHLRQVYEICRRDGASWREQLIALDVQPEPPRWSPLPQEDP